MTQIHPTKVYVVMQVQGDDYSGVSRDELLYVFDTRAAAQAHLDIWKSSVNSLYIQEEILHNDSSRLL